MFSMLTACPGARQLQSMEPSAPRTAKTAQWELQSTYGCKGSKNAFEKKPKPPGKRSMVGKNVKKVQMWGAVWNWSCERIKHWDEQSSWALGWGLRPVAHLQTAPWGGRGLLLIPSQWPLSPTPCYGCANENGSASTTGAVDHGHLSNCRGTEALQAFWHKVSCWHWVWRSKASWVQQHCVCVLICMRTRETQSETKT